MYVVGLFGLLQFVYELFIEIFIQESSFNALLVLAAQRIIAKKSLKKSAFLSMFKCLFFSPFYTNISCSFSER